MKNLIVYYGDEDTATLKADLAEFRAEVSSNYRVRTLDARVTTDAEFTDVFTFTEHVEDYAKDRIRALYKPSDAREIPSYTDIQGTSSDGSDGLSDGPVAIPADWSKLKWPQLYQLASRIVGDGDGITKRTDATKVIEAELARRAAEDEE